MMEDVYRKLSNHLDSLPGGFPPSETGADLVLLARLFDPQEADLATYLTPDREGTQVIANRAGLPFAEVEERLKGMSGKGLILSFQKSDGPTLYQGIPWVVGIYELQVNKLDEALINDLYQYWRTREKRPKVETIPQMRTIPVGESITPHMEALPYEQVDALIEHHDRFLVAPCICRRVARMTGDGCDAPEESCLVFGEWADYFAQNVGGRMIDRAEVFEILKRADAANLVLQPSNSREIEFLCCCCGCCCGVLGGLKMHPAPAQVVANAFIAALEPGICQGCWDCLARCQMDALTADGDHVVLNLDRCIGCGLCVTTCPSGALTLLRKPESEPEAVPVNIDATWRIISLAKSRMGNH
jgi:NAD-dependent dihydropyrimidine dehydrogenase PreA subunit